MLQERLRQKVAAIAQRWLAAALSVYPADAAAAFRRQQDPFANPVGHALRTAAPAALEALLQGRDAEETCAALGDVLKMRAVQELPPSQAIAFIFSLKESVRAELGSEDVGLAAAELAELNGRIDRLALAAFDVYVRCRGRVYELRIDEVKRVAGAIARGMGRGVSWPETRSEASPSETSKCVENERGGSR